MTITPLRLYHGAVANGAPVVVYTVPAGVVVVVKRLLVPASAGAAVTVNLAGQPVFSTETVAANKRIEQILETPLAAGETIAAGATGGGLVLLADGFSIS